MKSLRSGGITRRTACGMTTKRSACEASGRASAPPPPGSGARTRCRRGTPRTRTPSTRGRARRRPRRAAIGTPGSCERGDAEAEDVDDEDRRDAAEEVRVDDASARIGKNTGPGKPRSTAITSANTRMKTSAIRKIFTLIQKAERMSGNDSSNSCRSKNACLTSSQPDELTTTSAMTATKSESRRGRRRRPAAAALRQAAEDPRAAVLVQRGYFRIGAPGAPSQRTSGAS